MKKTLSTTRIDRWDLVLGMVFVYPRAFFVIYVNLNEQRSTKLCIQLRWKNFLLSLPKDWKLNKNCGL